MPVAIFLLISAITVLSVFAIERGEDARAAAQLRSRANAIGSALERRANASSAYLRAGAALLATLDEVPVARFRRFVSELRLDADYRGTEGVGWAMGDAPLISRRLPGGSALSFEIRDGRLVYALGVNAQRDLAMARRLVERGVPVDPEALANPAQPLAALLKRS